MDEEDLKFITGPDEDGEGALQSAYDIIDVLILYLSVANNPDLPDNLREFFTDMVENYLEHNQTSLEEIYEKHFKD